MSPEQVENLRGGKSQAQFTMVPKVMVPVLERAEYSG